MNTKVQRTFAFSANTQHVDDLLGLESLSCHDRILRLVGESLPHRLDSIQEVRSVEPDYAFLIVRAAGV